MANKIIKEIRRKNDSNGIDVYDVGALSDNVQMTLQDSEIGITKGDNLTKFLSNLKDKIFTLLESNNTKLPIFGPEKPQGLVKRTTTSGNVRYFLNQNGEWSVPPIFSSAQDGSVPAPTTITNTAVLDNYYLSSGSHWISDYSTNHKGLVPIIPTEINANSNTRKVYYLSADNSWQRIPSYPPIATQNNNGLMTSSNCLKLTKLTTALATTNSWGYMSGADKYKLVNLTTAVATTTSDGYMSQDDKSKLEILTTAVATTASKGYMTTAQVAKLESIKEASDTNAGLITADQYLINTINNNRKLYQPSTRVVNNGGTLTINTSPALPANQTTKNIYYKVSLCFDILPTGNEDTIAYGILIGSGEINNLCWYHSPRNNTAAAGDQRYIHLSTERIVSVPIGHGGKTVSMQFWALKPYTIANCFLVYEPIYWG